MRAANLLVKFLLELAALALFAYWGAHTGHSVWRVVLAVTAPVLMALVWARFAAPRSQTRLSSPLRIPLELGVFALAALAGYVAGARLMAIGFALVVVVNAAGLSVFHQWDE